MNPVLFITAATLGFLLLIGSDKSVKSAQAITNGKINLGSNLYAFPKIQVPDPKQKAPLVIVLHGRNATEKQLEYAVPTDLPARIMFLRANLPNNVFFVPRLIHDPAIVKPAIESAGVTLANGINKLLKIYPTNKVIIFGFSQGAELAEYMATQKWSLPLGVASFSGGLTKNLFPVKGPSGDITIKIWHGANDKVVPYQMDVDTANAFEDTGYDVTFETGKNLSHVSPPKKIADAYLRELVE